MIVNAREYRITRAAASRFEAALTHVEQDTAEQQPLLQKAVRESIVSELEVLREQLAEYEALQAGQITVLHADSLAGLPDALIRARISGLTQKQLGARLGVKEQQVQRYESTRYAGVALQRIAAVADALGVHISERVVLPHRIPGKGLAPPQPAGARPSAATRSYGFAGALVRAGLALDEVAERINIPVPVALKLQRGGIDPLTLPDRFLSRLATLLHTSLDETRTLVGGGAPRARTERLGAGGMPVVPFAEALLSCPDLTESQRDEWIDVS